MDIKRKIKQLELRSAGDDGQWTENLMSRLLINDLTLVKVTAFAEI